MIKFEQTGERFIPTQSDTFEVMVNIDRYYKALPFCAKKRVLDLGCGSGLGTYLYSLVAEYVIGVDYNEDAFNYAGLFPHDENKVEFMKLDVEKEPHQLLGLNIDTVVALEFLEHITDPSGLLAMLPYKQLVFSLPLSSMAISKWHKFAIDNGNEGIEDIKKLISQTHDLKVLELLSDRWVFGVAEKR